MTEAEEQEDVYVVNKLSSATQDDMNRTAPLPPQQKVNVSSLMVEHMDWIHSEVLAMGENLEGLYVKFAQSLTLAKTLAIAAIGIACLSVLLNIAMIVMVGYIIGRVR